MRPSRFAFLLALVAPAPALAGPPARLVGAVHESGTRAPLASATVALRSRDGKLLATVETDAEGRFSVELAAPGAIRVVVAATDHDGAEFPETVPAATTVEVVYHLARKRYAVFETTVRGDRAREEVARTTLSTEEVQKIPGTHGDALRAITNLPGVARAPFDTGQLVIWGAAPGDSVVLVGGHSIPLAFHFGLGSSVFNSNLLERIDYIPGNFGVRYGRAIGGIIDITPRAGTREGYHGYANVDFIDAGAMVEGPLGKGSFAVAARRSIIDLALAVAGQAADLGFVLSPRYYDYQAILDQPLFGGKLKVMVYGSDDQLALVVKNAPDADPAVKGRFETRIWFHALNAGWRRRFGDLELELTASAGPQHTDFGLAQTVGYTLDVFEYDARLEARYRVSSRLRLTAGFDYAGDWFHATIKAPYVAPEGQLQPPITASPSRAVAEGAWEYNPALYLEARIEATPRLTLTPGLRVDYFSGQRGTFDPRLNVRFTVAARTFLFGGIGLFHQASPAPFADAMLGNPRLRPQEALQISAGVETRPIARLPSLSLKVTGFYKDVRFLAATSDQLVVRDGRIVPEIYSDGGVGRIFGVELLLRQDLSRYLWGWVAYTLSRSERRDHPGDAWRLFPFDQTHILTVVVSARLPFTIDLGARFRYVTGNPDTPIDGGVYFADYDVYVALPGALYSTRQPSFYQLDLRVDKRFVFNRWTFSIYLDVANLTNHQNVDGYVNPFDYGMASSRHLPVTGFPIFPSLGMKGAF